MEKRKTVKKKMNLKCMAMTIAMMLNMLCLNMVCFASGEMSELEGKITEAGNSIYTFIASITSVVGGLVIVICFFLMMLSKDQRTVEESIKWMKRVAICWFGIMMASTIIKFMTSITVGNGETPKKLIGDAQNNLTDDAQRFHVDLGDQVAIVDYA